MSQTWNNYSKNNYLNPKEINSGNISNYQRMLAETDPRIANQYEFTFNQGSRVSPRIIKNPNPSLQTILSRNVGTTGRGIASGLKATGGTTAKLAGRVSPGLGAGLTGYDAFRSYQIADEMEKINKIQPNSFPKEAIDFYRNKGRAITAGAGVGLGAGGVLGAGVFSVPGALIGTGVGGGLAGLGYELAQRKNPYANYTITPEQYELLRKSNKGNSTNNINNTGDSTGTNGVKGNEGIGGQPTTKAQALALAQQLGSNTPIANQQEADTQQANINAINNYISKLQEINQPYIESLQRFADNYGDLYNQNQLYNRRMRDLSAMTGSPLWYQSAKDYNPLEVEATKIDLQKKIQDAQAGNIDELNKLQGNVAIANSLGLPSEAALANKDLLNAYVNQQRAQLNYNARVYDTNIDNATRVAIKQGDWETAFKLQNMKNQGNLRNAFASSGAFYSNPQQMANVMKMLGVEPRYIPVANGLDEQGLPAVQPAINYYAGESK